jgi:RNA polymerase sigma-70 factor, ECF subfamily
MVMLSPVHGVAHGMAVFRRPAEDVLQQTGLRDTVMTSVSSATPFAASEDVELLRRVAQQDRQAFHELYTRYASLSLGVAMRVVDDRAAAEDVLQEAFIKVWHQAGRYDPKLGNVRNWLLVVVHRQSIDALRRRQSRPALYIDAEQHEDWDIADEETDVHAEVIENLSHARVRAAMSGLPDAHRRIIELSYFKGMTHREIASHLDEPLGTVHSRARQAMVQLKKLLWHHVS